MDARRMDLKKAEDFDPELLILFDAYVHGALDRRGFIERASRFAVGGMTGVMLLDALNPRFAEAQQVPEDDPRLSAQFVEYPSPTGSGTMRGYLVRPAKTPGKLPGVLVIHENRGLNPHIEDIVRRVALDGFMAFAPMRSSLSAATPATRTRRGRCSRSSTRPRRGRTSWRRRSG